MSNFVKIQYSLERLKQKRFGLTWFFKRDGNKWSLNESKAKKCLMGGSVLLLTLQLCDIKPVLVRDTPFPAPINITATQVFDISRLPVVNFGLHGKNGKTYHLAAPELLGRPIDLSKIPPGSMLSATLVSGASNGLVRAEVKDALMVNGESLIPQGAFLLGTGTSTEERLFIGFNNVIFRDGSFAQIQAQACDQGDKIVGLKGSKIGGKALQIAGSLGLNFVAGFSQGLQQSHGEWGATVKDPTIGNALLQGTSQTAVEESKNLMQELKDRVPIIEVAAGTDICVIFSANRP